MKKIKIFWGEENAYEKSCALIYSNLFHYYKLITKTI